MRQKRKQRARAAEAAARQGAPAGAEATAAAEPAAGADADTGAEPIAGADAELASGADADADSRSHAHLKRVIESLIFASEKPLPLSRIRELTGESRPRVLGAIVDELVEDYRDRGIVLDDIAGGYQFRTHPGTAQWVQQLVGGRPVRLSRAQLETLAIIAYRQPITRPEMDEIRGVDSGSTLRVLLERNLIRVLGKKEEPGRPLLYGTTKAFLQFFNLGDLRDLPTLREYHELTEDSLREVEKLAPAENSAAPPAAAETDPPAGETGAAAGETDPAGETAAAGETGAAAAETDPAAGATDAATGGSTAEPPTGRNDAPGSDSSSQASA